MSMSVATSNDIKAQDRTDRSSSSSSSSSYSAFNQPIGKRETPGQNFMTNQLVSNHSRRSKTRNKRDFLATNDAYGGDEETQERFLKKPRGAGTNLVQQSTSAESRHKDVHLLIFS